MNKERLSRMPGKKFAESEKIRKWIALALQNGCDSPRSVLEYIEQNSTITASIPTIGNVMKDLGYEPVGYKWEKVK